MPNWGNVLQQTITGGIGAGMGLLLEGHNDRRQIRQQQKLQDMQIAGNKELTDYNYAKQLQMWKDTNFGAQKEQLKAAGLNPGLLYGMGGAGGAISGSSGSGVSGSNSPSGGGEIMGMMNQKMQLELLNAQKENIEADTANKQATATKTSGVDTTLAITQARSLTQGIEESKAKQYLAQADKYLRDMQGIVANRSLDDTIDTIHWNTKRAFTELQNAENETYINRTAREDKIEIIKQAAIAGALNNILTKAQTRSTEQGIKESEARIQQITNGILQRWAEIEQGNTKLAIDEFKAEIDANYPNIMNTLGKGIDDGIGAIFQLLTGKGRPRLKSVNK